jgi:ribosomal protein L40E
MNCPKCTTSNSESAKFCKSCGFHLLGTPAQIPVPQPSGLVCLKCGVENNPHAKFCKACGALVSRESTALSQPPVPAPPTVQPPAPVSPPLPVPPPSPGLQPVIASPSPAKPKPATAPAVVASTQTSTMTTKPLHTGVISSRSSKPLQLAVGAVLLALLGALIWVFTGFKSGDLAPPGSVQSPAKSTQVEPVVSTTAEPLAPASAPVLPTQAAVVAAIVSVPASVTESAPQASKTVKPTSSLEKQEQTMPLPAQAPKTSSSATKPALRTESAAPNATQQNVSPMRRVSPPNAVSPPPVASVAAPAPSAPAPTPQPDAVSQASILPVAPAAQNVAPSSPKEACGKRVFIALAICMQEQCSNARFNAHPQCVQMRQQQKNNQERANNGSN